MSEIETGGPAFPCMPPQDAGSGCATGYPYPDAGMTLRDYFAAKTIQSTIAWYMSHSNNANKKISTELMDVFTKEAYQMADAMLKARMK